ncbi:MAG: hypothetical protein J6N76_07900 [Lachnospiraceae bacterium]|nr:hypothetical protein [Lachnospiraceae bacterium]
MEQIIKAFLGLYLILTMVVVGISVMNTSIQAKNADKVLDTLALAWEASDYRLTDEMLSKNLEDDYSVTTKKARSGANGKTEYATMTLRYKYRLPILGLDIDREISRSIR